MQFFASPVIIGSSARYESKAMYSSIEHFVGNTPLVRLKRIPGSTGNVLLAKLEGNNPAG